jgi:ABC-type nitrate/sulfonate/bicarbonate transport system ATPase subunit
VSSSGTAAMSRPLATLSGVGLSYPNGTEALRGLDLEIREGEILGVTGPSGCGKSSLLSLLSGGRVPTRGTISWDSTGDSGAQSVAMMFQKDTLLPWLTVQKNANLYWRLNRRTVSRSDYPDELLALVGLDQVRDKYPYQLSGGMRRRLAFVSALAARPRLLLLDEPFSALDEPTRVTIHQDVRDILKDLDTTVVLVTHDLAEATTLCDRVVILSRGPGGYVAHTHTVPFTGARTVLELRESPEFLSFYGRLWHDLSAEIARGPAVVSHD